MLFSKFIIYNYIKYCELFKTIEAMFIPEAGILGVISEFCLLQLSRQSIAT